MAVQVVVDFKVIDIDEYDLQRYVLAARLTPDAANEVIENPPVVEPGEAIALGELIENARL